MVISNNNFPFTFALLQALVCGSLHRILSLSSTRTRIALQIRFFFFYQPKKKDESITTSSKLYSLSKLICAVGFPGIITLKKTRHANLSLPMLYANSNRLNPNHNTAWFVIIL